MAVPLIDVHSFQRWDIEMINSCELISKDAFYKRVAFALTNCSLDNFESCLSKRPHFHRIMASFEDYDEFGNYIGADIDSDEEPDFSHEETTATHAPQQPTLEGYDDGSMNAGPGTALMEIDGGRYSYQEAC
jgi:hypothetical protein